MGAEASILKSYDLGLPYDVGDHKFARKCNRQEPKRTTYSIHPAVHKEDGSKVSVFVYNKAIEPKLGPSCAEVKF